LFTLEWTHPAIQACLFHAWKVSSRLVPTDESVNKLQLQRSWNMLVIPLSTVDTQLYNYNIASTR